MNMREVLRRSAAPLVAMLVIVTASSAVAQTRGGTLNVLVQPEPPTLMLGINQLGPVELVGSKIYQTLLTYDFDLKPQPVLAKSWTQSADGLTYSFTLQENVKWHDGKPFTADDVVFSTTKLLPETNPRARAILANVATVEAPDAHTVVFRLKQPFAPFLGAFVPSNMPMVPKHLYEGTDFRNNPANRTPIGTGPFKFAEWQRGEYIRLVRNPDYWKPGLPHLDEIYFRVLPDAAARAFALESQQVDVAGPDTIELFDIDRLLKLPHLEGTGRGSEFASPMSWIELNHRVKPLDDKRFRQALLHAIDRKVIVDTIWSGHARVPNGPIASAIRFHDADLKPLAFDPRRAEQLLDEMGLKRGADGTRVTLSLIPLPYGEAWKRMGEYIKQALGRVGIAVTLETMDPAAWVQRVSNWDYQMTVNRLQQFGDPAVGVARTYLSSNIRKGVMFNNTMGYSNARVDELFAKAGETVDDAARRALYREVQRVLADDVPVAWMIEIKTPTITNRKFRDVVTTALGVNDSFESARLAR
ncbi:MAG: ABC transporter substrate-binding protein [Alphaproteobacteria bacterium]|nr:ABC transporter substrate-binding protein [Alphaproteobacteria bacterium]